MKEEIKVKVQNDVDFSKQQTNKPVFKGQTNWRK